MTNADNPRLSRRLRYWLAPVLLIVGTLGSLAATSQALSAMQDPIDLGTAVNSAVVAGRAIAGTNLVLLAGNVDVSPGSTLTGFPPGRVRNGTVHLGDSEAQQVAADVAAAYANAAGQTPTATLAAELGGTTLTTGVYKASGGTFTLNGRLILDGGGNNDAVFIFQADSALTTARSSSVSFINGAKADNVFWQVGDQATLGPLSTFVGNILAQNSITIGRSTNLYGRAAALSNTVTLEGPTVFPPTRVVVPQRHFPRTTTTLTSSQNPSVSGQPVVFTATVQAVATGLPSPTGRVIFRDGSTPLGSALTDLTGVAKFTTTGLSVGTHQITAVYVSRGTADLEFWIYFAPSRSAALTQQVLAAAAVRSG
ncbi:ice-binding family protein [Streptosporangium sp. NPDC051023]|uniref:ice-binding family protein n=1 Tax=Streptosporangium sp. NPDC051023 TaxID=3155410 RepID=UPI00344BB7FA